MGCVINDKMMIEELQRFRKTVKEECNKLGVRDTDFEHPLDKDVLGTRQGSGLLYKLMSGDASIGYDAADKLDDLWRVLLEKSIKCLRYFDKRESFLKKTKPDIVVYGLDSLVDYHHRYTDFESLMYGANSHYRDHVFHVVRVWMLGIFALNKPMSKDGNREDSLLISHITLDGGAQFPDEINYFEKISMWTIISLCHDLGYPLEKADQILSKTQNMMKDFIPDPNIWSNFGYSGVQNSINEYILRFISTKMVECDTENDDPETQYFKGRIQPKYYLKFAKSLESFKHGIISSVIIFKLLVYFMESDFNLNDDYIYNVEDARQFYIRREILRAIAAHTCSDTYNIHITTLSSLLFLCDELQEWGRKSWEELYTGFKSTNVELTLDYFAQDGIKFTEQIETASTQNKDVIDHIIRVFKKQYAYYRSVFRDGLDGEERDFTLTKTMYFVIRGSGDSEGKYVTVEFSLPSKEKREKPNADKTFRIDISELPDADREEFNSALKRFKPMIYKDDIEIITAVQ